MIYFDNSATSFPKPESVYRKMDGFYRRSGANPGRSGHKLSIQANEEMENARQLIADFFHIPEKNNIAFTFNATDALNMAVYGLLKEGDEVISTSLDHNSLSRPLARLAGSRRIKVARVDPVDGKIRPETIKSRLNKKTKLVALNHASNVTGWIQPAGEIGRIVKENSSAYFLVDAAQTAGIVPIDAEAMMIDLLAFTGHKALYGPTGTGGLYVSENIKLDCFRVGGSGIESETESHPDYMPFRLEAGTPNIAGIAGLAEGVRFVNETGINKIREKESHLRRLLVKELGRIKGIILYLAGVTDESLGILSFNIEGLSPVETASILDSEDIAVRPGLHCSPAIHKFLGTFPEGSVRISLGYFNTEEEVERFIKVLSGI